MTTTRQHVNAWKLWTKTARRFRETADGIAPGDPRTASVLRYAAKTYDRRAEDAIVEAAQAIAASRKPARKGA